MSEATELIGSQEVDAVLLDVAMQGATGFGDAASLRERVGSACPIVALTWVGRRDVFTDETAATVAFAGVCTKPVRPAALRAALIAAFDGEAEEQTTSRARTSSTRSSEPSTR